MWAAGCSECAPHRGASPSLSARRYLLSATITLGTNTVILGEGFAALVAKSGTPAWTNAAAPNPMIATLPGSTVQREWGHAWRRCIVPSVARLAAS